MTRKQLEYFMEQVPLIEARRALPIANLEAAVRDMTSPKRRPGEKIEVPEGGFRPNWQGQELLPSFASFGEGAEGNSLAPEALEDLRKNRAHVPMWVYELVNF